MKIKLDLIESLLLSYFPPMKINIKKKNTLLLIFPLIYLIAFSQKDTRHCFLVLFQTRKRKCWKVEWEILRKILLCFPVFFQSLIFQCTLSEFCWNQENRLKIFRREIPSLRTSAFLFAFTTCFFAERKTTQNVSRTYADEILTSDTISTEKFTLPRFSSF